VQLDRLRLDDAIEDWLRIAASPALADAGRAFAGGAFGPQARAAAVQEALRSMLPE
jgi:hypothetical protein